MAVLYSVVGILIALIYKNGRTSVSPVLSPSARRAGQHPAVAAGRHVAGDPGESADGDHGDRRVPAVDGAGERDGGGTLGPLHEGEVLYHQPCVYCVPNRGDCVHLAGRLFRALL